LYLAKIVYNASIQQKHGVCGTSTIGEIFVSRQLAVYKMRHKKSFCGLVDSETAIITFMP